MIVYTDLFNRTKNYTLTDKQISKIKNLDIELVTKPHPQTEVYFGDKFTMEHYKQMPNLKWIHLSKTGFNKFNFPSHITVTNTPESSNGVAEYALAGILYLLRGLDRMTLDRKSFDCNIPNILSFSEVKCLIVGYGRIGKELYRLLKLLGMPVDYVVRGTKGNYNSPNFVINTLPLNKQTINYFNRNIFEEMNKNSYIINVGRGETINELDLYVALKNKTIRGAFLDVVQNEPLKKNHKLLELDNVFISPHIANSIKSNLDTQVKIFIFNLEKYQKNKLISNIKI